MTTREPETGASEKTNLHGLPDLRDDVPPPTEAERFHAARSVPQLCPSCW